MPRRHILTERQRATLFAASATISPILRSVKTPGIGRHGGRIASVPAWAGLGAFWKGRAGGQAQGRALVHL